MIIIRIKIIFSSHSAFNFSKPVSHTLTTLIFPSCMWPARLRHPENTRRKKRSSVLLLSSWGSRSYCFHRSLWSNPLDLKPSDTVAREETRLLSGKRKWKSATLASLTLLSSLHHSWSGSLSCSHPFSMTYTSLFPVITSSPSSTCTPPEHLQIPLRWRLALSWVCNSSQFSNIWKFN